MKKSYLESKGKTVDNKTVLSGVFIFKCMDTKGIPLEIILMSIDQNKYSIDWTEFIESTLRANWKIKSTLLKINNAVEDIYSKEYAEQVKIRAEYYCTIKGYVDVKE